METIVASASDKTVGFGVKEPGLHHEELEIVLPMLGEKDVEIEITHCGICHSDVHLAKGEWGPWSVFPQVGGHEVVGIVRAKGPGVSHLDIGSRVGVGWYKSACGRCRDCLGDYHSLCSEVVATCAGGSSGGFAKALRVDSDYAFPIPEHLPSQYAAPLLCGGVTVFSPLVEYEAVGLRVGVLGIGGLGSMAIQFARARGNYVVALSSSADKAELCKSLGAHEFVDARDAVVFRKVKDSLDLVIVCVSAGIDFAPYLELLRTNGTIVFVGAASTELKLPIFGPLISKQIRITGSATGGRKRITDMLQFAADHKIYPLIEEFAMADINAAMAAVIENRIRFRAVLVW